MPPLLLLQDVALTFGVAPLLSSAGLAVAAGDRICLIGRNGSGKSTLLRIAAALVQADAGERFAQPGTTIQYLSQEPDLAGFITTLAYVEAGFDNATAGSRHRALYLLKELGLSGEEDPASLSGGEARRAALARALAPSPDILLLDEPTNHLDLPGIEWLERELAELRSGIVLISHDRRLLERFSRRTVWLDRGITRLLDQGFAAFEPWRDAILEQEESEQHKLGRKIAMEEDWLRYGVTARRTRNQRRLAELHVLRRKRREYRAATGTARLLAVQADLSGRLVTAAEGVSKASGDNTVVRKFSTRVMRGDRVGIVGPNGAGKTTLLNLLTGALAPDAGEVRLGTNLARVTLDQQRDHCQCASHQSGADAGSRPHRQRRLLLRRRSEPRRRRTKAPGIVGVRIPKRFGLDLARDIQVLCPMNRGGLGGRSLNIELQKELNPPGEIRVDRFGWTFCPGDKVMQVENDYDRDVYNGDLGVVSHIDMEEGELHVDFDGPNVVYSFGELDELVLAYATTIHKSQGSEYPAVVIPLSTQHYPMLQRNLVYTGVTRGKRLVVLVGQRKALAIAVKGAGTRKRWSKLGEWLTGGGRPSAAVSNTANPVSDTQRTKSLTDIYVDGDACPVREEIYRVATRLRLNVFVVSNGSRPIRSPGTPNVSMVLVGESADAADDWIAERIEATDVCVTADIPLASRCLKKGARVVSPIGKQWTEANIGNALASRDIARHLRELGQNTGGPAPLTKRDRSQFLSALDTALQAALRARS